MRPIARGFSRWVSTIVYRAFIVGYTLFRTSVNKDLARDLRKLATQLHAFQIDSVNVNTGRPPFHDARARSGQIRHSVGASIFADRKWTGADIPEFDHEQLAPGYACPTQKSDQGAK